MNIALVHYHLRPGGVTQVMLHQARTMLAAGEDVLVLTGETPVSAAEWTEIPLAIIPALHYDRYRPGGFESTGSGVSAKSGQVASYVSAELARAVERAVTEHGGADIVHVHNPLIRKNSSLLGALGCLAGTFPLLLQNHDLAEDFRPDVYTGEDYPENCHYGVINSRDYRFLLEAGLTQEGLHLIPNEVRKVTMTPHLPKTRYLYPVRGIRRKNLGEFLLLSLYINPSGGKRTKTTSMTMTLTQPPSTEQDGPLYRRWKETAAALELPVEFEAGLTGSFADLMGSARAVVTTSVKEGFGFSFLEPWTAGIAVTGRRIDYVCRDFEAAGLCFDGLYSTLDIPGEYTCPERLRTKTEDALFRVYRAFGAEIPPPVLEALETRFKNRDTIDFGIMDEESQEYILRLAAGDKAIREGIKKANPFLEQLAENGSDGNPRAAVIDRDALIEANRAAVSASYSREKIAAILKSVYSKVLSPVNQRINRARLLDRYLDPSRLFLAGISPPGESHA